MESIMPLIVSCVYFFLPAYFANMAPPLAKRVGIFTSLYSPIDGGKKFHGTPLLGDHKTWRGAVFAILAGAAVFCLQEWLYQFSFFKGISIIDYRQAGIWLVGFLMPLGTVLGDLGAAFAKRRMNLKPGAAFIPWDQTNYVIGNLVILEPFLKLGPYVWLSIFCLTFFLHIIFNRLGYVLGVHGAKW